MFSTLLSVAFGGAIGASARYLTGLAAARLFGAGFPMGTISVNVIGSFLMGVMFVALAQSGEKSAAFLMTGVLGGFTTFSAFSLDAFQLYEKGEVAMAAIYVVASVLLSVLALIAGILLARGVTV